MQWTQSAPGDCNRTPALRELWEHVQRCQFLALAYACSPEPFARAKFYSELRELVGSDRRAGQIIDQAVEGL